MDHDRTAALGNTALALAAIVKGHPDIAETFLRDMPRSERGAMRIALEDLSIMIERLGN